jgi:hypothetical protein
VASPFRTLGSATRSFLEGYGALAALFGRSVAGTRRLPRYAAEALGHYRTIAIGSIPLIFVTSIFMGFVLGVQIGAQTAPRRERRRSGDDASGSLVISGHCGDKPRVVGGSAVGLVV